MIDIKRFAGVLNTDDDNYTIMSPQHSHAKNLRFVGGQQGLTAQNIKGNYLISNSSLPAGTNECIGVFFDSVKQRIIWFNYNSNGNHGIYQLDVQTSLVSSIFICGTNSATDIFNFDLDYPVHSAAVVYRTSGEGDLLYWTDGANRPMYLNLDTVAALQPFTQDMVYAIKLPPMLRPAASYDTDAAVLSNNVHNRYFRFAYRWVYASGEKSTFSPTSVLPLPNNANPNQQFTPNVNNYILVVPEPGTTADFEATELFGQEFNGTTWDDFFLITSIPTGSASFQFKFFNDGVYSPVTEGKTVGGQFVPVSDLRFSWLPDKANTLALLNGNSIMYGGITEGYDKILREDVNVQITSALETFNLPITTPVWRWGQKERLGLIYFDKWGKTNGVVSFLQNSAVDSTNFDVTSPQYPGSSAANYTQVPVLSGSISSLPPSWAETYQWVRLDLSPINYVQYLTNDYQVEGAYTYLCIQALIDNNTKNNFIPSYEFTDGDVVRIMAKYNDPTQLSATAYNIQYEYSVLGTVERDMNAPNPASKGTFLKILNPSGTEPIPAYSQKMFIEIFTPNKGIDDKAAIFYEFGEVYSIYTSGGIRYHRGMLQDQTVSQPATFRWRNLGYNYIKQRLISLSPFQPVTNQFIGSLYMMDRNYYDNQKSKANSNSRGWPIEINAKEQYFPVTSRWGRSYVQDTDINELNLFWPEDQDTIDRAGGDIRRIVARDRIARVFQDRKIGQYGIYGKYIQNNQGQSELVTTDEIITVNNIQYYQGTVGLCGYPTNLVSTLTADYFTDVVTGRSIRLSRDGITDLGLLYKGQFYFPDWVLPYNKEILRSNGKIAKVMAYFDNFDNEYHVILQGGNLTGGGAYPDRHFSFNEPRNGFCCDEYDFHPEWAISANGITYSWVNGELYKHDVNGNNYCNFYGQQFSASLTLVFNDRITEKKTWQSISQIASAIWASPTKGDIYTDAISYVGQVQQTHLADANYTLLESKPSAAFYRDENSRGGWINGDVLKGSYLVVKLVKENASSLVSISEVAVYFVTSPLNLK